MYKAPTKSAAQKIAEKKAKEKAEAEAKAKEVADAVAIREALKKKKAEEDVKKTKPDFVPQPPAKEIRKKVEKYKKGTFTDERVEVYGKKLDESAKEIKNKPSYQSKDEFDVYWNDVMKKSTSARIYMLALSEKTAKDIEQGSNFVKWLQNRYDLIILGDEVEGDVEDKHIDDQFRTYTFHWRSMTDYLLSTNQQPMYDKPDFLLGGSGCTTKVCGIFGIDALPTKVGRTKPDVSIMFTNNGYYPPISSDHLTGSTLLKTFTEPYKTYPAISSMVNALKTNKLLDGFVIRTLTPFYKLNEKKEYVEHDRPAHIVGFRKYTVDGKDVIVYVDTYSPFPEYKKIVETEKDIYDIAYNIKNRVSSTVINYEFLQSKKTLANLLYKTQVENKDKEGVEELMILSNMDGVQYIGSKHTTDKIEHEKFEDHFIKFKEHEKQIEPFMKSKLTEELVERYNLTHYKDMPLEEVKKLEGSTLTELQKLNSESAKAYNEKIGKEVEKADEKPALPEKPFTKISSREIKYIQTNIILNRLVKQQQAKNPSLTKNEVIEQLKKETNTDSLAQIPLKKLVELDKKYNPEPTPEAKPEPTTESSTEAKPEPAVDNGGGAGLFKTGGLVKARKRGQAVTIVAHDGELVVPKQAVAQVLKSSAWRNHVESIAKQKGITFQQAKKIALGKGDIVRKKPRRLIEESSSDESDW